MTSTDPRWNANAGGLPEPQTQQVNNPPPTGRIVFGPLADPNALDFHPGTEAFAARLQAWGSPTAGTWLSPTGEPLPIASTIAPPYPPPHAEPLSPFVRSRIDAALRLLEEAVAEMKRIKELDPK